MPTFAESVSALLTVYDNCLELLKSFKKSTRAASRGVAVVTTAQSRLKRSLRSDRSRVLRVYHYRLSYIGSLLEEGDSKSSYIFLGMFNSSQS